MMNPRLWSGLAVAICACMLASGQSSDEARQADRRGQRVPPEERYVSEGFWPTQRQIELFFDRVADSMVEMYDLDEQQFLATRQILRETMPKFLKENQRELKALLNEFIEAQLGGEPPDPNAIQSWSSRALPMLEKFETVVQGITDEMREFLTDEQAVKLDAEHAAFKTGLSLITGKLHVWAEGGFNPETDWPTDPRERRRREHEERVAARAEMEKARQAVLAAGNEAGPATGKPGDPPAEMVTRPGERDEWELYVVSFIRRYDLNEEQQQQAYALLRAKQEERDQYLKSKRAELDAVRERLAKALNDEARKAAQQAFDTLNRPVSRMFTQLKDRLERLPTRKQRKDAARASLRELAQSQPALKDAP